MEDSFEENNTFVDPLSVQDGSKFEAVISSTSPKIDPEIQSEEEKFKDDSRQDASILSCLLCLVVVSLYQKINFLLKFFLMTLTALVQIVIYYCISTSSSPSIQGITGISTSNLSVTSNVKGVDFGAPNTSPLMVLNQPCCSGWPSWLEPVLLMSVFIVLLHLLDRQIEIMSRSDFLWMTKLHSEEDGGDTMLGINKVIIV